MEAFAVIETGGKQYKVAAGDSIAVEKIPGSFAEGDPVSFDKVLLLADGEKLSIGSPYLPGARVEGKLETSGRARKVTVIKYKAKSRYFKKRGHRQPFSRVKIVSLPPVS